MFIERGRTGWSRYGLPGDMFLPSEPNATEYFADCARRFDVAPRPTWEENEFWGADIAALSRVFPASRRLETSEGGRNNV